MALRVLAHFLPGEPVLEVVSPESDWLDVRWCHEDDDDTLHRELPEAEVVWHVLRPLSGDDLRRGERLRLVHKLGAGVNTIAVETASELGIAVANMPGANAPSVAEGAVLLMLAALRRLPVLDGATREGRGWPSDPCSTCPELSAQKRVPSCREDGYSAALTGRPRRNRPRRVSRS